jgi:folylpolyglutamate synthase/dihydropteroate synthase
MQALAGSLKPLLGRKPVVVLGALGSKDIEAMAGTIAGMASMVICTEPNVLGKHALPVTEVAQALRAVGFGGAVECEPEPYLAVMQAEEIGRTRNEPVVVTGSLYLVGEVRRGWYPDAAIVSQRTPWPRQT